jgi:hypothetical protein
MPAQESVSSAVQQALMPAVEELPLRALSLQGMRQLRPRHPATPGNALPGSRPCMPRPWSSTFCSLPSAAGHKATATVNPTNGLRVTKNSPAAIAAGLFLGSSDRYPALRSMNQSSNYLMMLVTRPEPTVRPPSRIAKPRPSSIAIGWMSATVISVLSPGMTISVPSGSVITPVTSVVRK